MKREHTEFTTEWSESETTARYALNLPGTEAQVPLDFFRDKQNVFGQYAVVEPVSEGIYEAVRDPLGIGKMFYCQSAAGSLEFSGEWRELLPHGNSIYALPRGYHVRLTATGEIQKLGTLAPNPSLTAHFSEIEDFFSPETQKYSREALRFKEALCHRLDAVFKVISGLETRGFRVFVALSGGLDSSIIANQAKRHLAAPIACTLDLGNSEDAEKSALISREIGIEHVVFKTSEDEILNAVWESPVLCQDYRDFNVHCTALNLLLAKDIRALAEERKLDLDKLIILTGDIMNELTCDYAAEVVDGTTYYRLPRVGPKTLQQVLVGGLDTSDREVLPFRHYGLSCIQPYAATYDLYLSLPESVLKLENVKRILNEHLVPPSVMERLPQSKLRAQVGSKETMGVLGLCHYRGITELDFLKKLLGEGEPDKAKVPITMGRYEVQRFEK